MSTQKSGVSVRKVLRWLVLAVLVIVIVLFLKKPQPVAEPMSAPVVQQRVEEFQGKVRDLQQSHQQGVTAQAQFTTEEINAVVQQGTAEQVSVAANQVKPTSTAAEPPPEIKPAQFMFADDHVTGQFVVNLYGKDIYVTVSGKLGAADGYVTFEPTEFKFGDMPVPVSLVNARLQSKLQDPENHEKLKLPDFVSDIRVEHGQLIVVEK
jgi:hypothetical protein